MFTLRPRTTPPHLAPRPTPRRRPVGHLIGLLVALVLVGSACSLPGTGGDAIDSGIVVDPAITPGDALQAETITERWVDASARAVTTGGFVDVHSRPDGDPIATLNPLTAFGTPRVLLVEEQADGWIKVRLPARPNHQSGWVRADRVVVEPLDVRVEIDLEARTLAVHRGGETIVETPVAIGTADNPTPTGTFYVTDKLETPDPDGAYGPFALGLSGYSETLTEFAGGDGQIGIHGTNDPTSIGSDVSHGCVRVPNEIITELADLLPLGTPVHVV